MSAQNPNGNGGAAPDDKKTPCEHCQGSGRALFTCGMIHQCVCRVQKSECMNCGAAMTIMAPPSITINGLQASSIVMTHEEGVVCPNCQAIYRFAFTDDQRPSIGLVLVKAPESPIHKPGSISGRGLPPGMKKH